ncbi:hypothetical protein BDN67DRAFT_966768 [Paxillus ammoniavirescens]|nr:hypothetical protein BDN67DRAFT_966768 [Paxillus ammoniavirescens]
MAVSFRLARLLDHSLLWYLACAALASWAVRSVSAASLVSVQDLHHLQDPNVILSDNNGTITVYSPLTGQEIPQGIASDGSGSGFSTTAIVWIVFSFTVGGPLLLVGFRGWRLTLGAAIGAAAALASWAVFVNTLDNVGISDAALTTVVLSLFGLGFLLGLLELSRVAGILVLGILGGLAIGIRIVLLRSGLLVSDSTAYFVNWLVIGFCGLAGSILVVWKQRIGLLNGCASTGSFLCALGFDLVINQQSGMSRGLRFLLDRNRYHVVDTVINGYSPPMTTVIILAVSLAITPAFAYAQWKVFKRPFSGIQTEDFGSVYDPKEEELPHDEESSSPESSIMPCTPATEKLPEQLFDKVKKEGSSTSDCHQPV